LGYLHIPNLYKDRTILMFREVWALEKLHGTSSHISYKDGNLSFFSGCASIQLFKQLFNEDLLAQRFRDLQDVRGMTIFGEAYGPILKMSQTYGNKLCFVAFDVQIGDNFLSVPQAEAFCLGMDIEFVYYQKTMTDLALLDAIKESPSVQAIRNGIGDDKRQEGIVLRPLIELRKNNGDRIICKHKNAEFMETATERPISAEKLQVMEEARAIATEWVTEMRLQHVLDKIPGVDIRKMGDIIRAMHEDVQREAAGEIVWSKEAANEVARKTSELAKAYFKRGATA